MFGCEDESVAVELRSLKKITTLDEIIHAVPKPKGAVPSFGLPKWQVMPLESKIPMIPGPEGSYNFTRKKLGKKLWTASANAEFDLSGLSNREIEFNYDPLHDEHLAYFFSKPSNRRRMINLGFVTTTGDAICSLKDYNTYRKYLKKLHNDSINQELSRRSSMNDERRALNLAEMFAEKDAERIRVREEKYNIHLQAREKYARQLEERSRRVKAKQLQMEERTKMLKVKRREAYRRRAEESKKRAAMIKQKLELAAYIERQKIVKILREWYKNDHQRKRAREERIAKAIEEKQKAIREKWNLRNELQKQQMEREKFLHQCWHQVHVTNVELYNAKVQRERKKLQRLVDKRKIFNKCHTSRHAYSQREGTCCIQRRTKKTNKKIQQKTNHNKQIGTGKTNNVKNRKKRRSKEVKMSTERYESKLQKQLKKTKIYQTMTSNVSQLLDIRNCKCDYRKNS